MMNDEMKNIMVELSPEDERIAEKLNQAAQHIELNPNFQAALESRLKDTHHLKGVSAMSLRKLLPALGWAVGLALLAWALNWVIHSLAPEPVPASGGTPTSVFPQEGPAPTPIVTSSTVYEWHGASLTLAVPLPDSPAEANVYLLKKDQPATLDEARALAARFGIQSEAYAAAGQISSTADYIFTDGRQMLSVHSNFYFNYTSDIVKNNQIYNGSPNPNAEAIIMEFLKSHGFDFAFEVEADGLRGGYAVRPISPDGRPMQYEYYSPPVMRVALDESGQVLSVQASLMDYDQAPLGTFGILSADEALQKMLDDNIQAGKIEAFHSSGSESAQEWHRQYPDNQTVTIYGYVTSYLPVDSRQPAAVFIDNVPATGSIGGMEALGHYTFVQATGQYRAENGIRKFNVESWDDKVKQSYFPGVLDEYNGQTFLITATDDGTKVTYPVEDLPPDVPLNTQLSKQELSITGVTVDGKLFWTDIRFIANADHMGGGGGGGGSGFYQLNLSGTPVPFPTAIPAGLNPPFDKPRVDGLRGMLSVTLHKKVDGSQTTEYNLIGKDDYGQYFNVILKGSSLQNLSAYQGLPFVVSGTVTVKDMMITINVEQYEIPFPDLKFQISKGTQKTEDIAGQTVTVFTLQSGQSYVQLDPNGDPNQSIIGRQGDVIQQEVLIIPDETFDGRPALRMYAGSIIEAGSPDLTITANQPHIIDDTQNPVNPPPSNYTPPSLTIEKAELVYFVSNPLYQSNDPSASKRSPYIQPAWHFYGHYSNGDEFDILIQALKQEFLSPEIAPYIQGG